jgi:Txe/YoeB family toxin of toxin-antitoxin system
VRKSPADERLESCLHQASAEGHETACGVGAAGGQKLLDLLAKDPFSKPPPFEKLVGDLAGAYSRRINIQHRLVYQVIPERRTVKVLRMWTHYE